MAEAKTLDPQKYGEQVNVLSVLSYHKLQDMNKLKEALETLQKENPSAVARVPDVIPAWLGLQAYGMKDLETADKYMTWATQNDQLQNVKKVIWRNLAKVRLALRKYDRALVASNNFLKDEDQPYRRADGMLDKASHFAGAGQVCGCQKDGGRCAGSGRGRSFDGFLENCSGGYFLCGEKSLMKRPSITVLRPSCLSMTLN